VLSAPETERAMLGLVRRGVAGVISADLGLEELLVDLRSILKGGARCTPSVANILMRHVGGTSGIGSPRLSPREAQIVRLIALGLSNKVIADQLHIALGTVKNHVHRILAKTSLRRRADLILQDPRLGGS